MKKAKLSQGYSLPTNRVVRRKRKVGTNVRDGVAGIEMNPLRYVVDPLKIELILAIIFDFCSWETLKHCRLVCRLWKEVSLRAWRTKAVLNPGPFRKKKREGLNSLTEYLEICQRGEFQLIRYPFTSFRILLRHGINEYLKEGTKPISDVARRMILCEDIHQYIYLNQNFMRFLSNFRSLQTLEIENGNWCWNKDWPFHPCNLKCLKLFHSSDVYHENYVRRYVNGAWLYNDAKDWEYLLQCFPKLEALSVVYHTTHDYIVDLIRILKFIKSFRNSGETNVMSIKELDVTHIPQTRASFRPHHQCQNHTEIIDTIVQCKLPLEALTVHLIWGELDLRKEILPIFHLLDSCKEKLRYLKTSFNVVVGKVDSELLSEYLEKRKSKPFSIRMEALKELHLCNGLWGFFILADLELPNLEKLVVDSGESTKKMNGMEQFQFTFPKERVYEKLDTLEFLDNRKIPGPETVRAFAKIMPNLARLTFPLDKFTFRIVCKSMKGLKSLNATAAQHRFVELDDFSLTGISKDGAGERRRSNITDLVHLTDLSIACGADWQEKEGFTDHSVVHGFLQLPKLYSLRASFTEISDEMKSKLMNHVKGDVNIQVKPKFKPEYYCDVVVKNGQKIIKWR